MALQGAGARARLKVGLAIAVAVGCGLLATRIETDNQLRSWTTPGEEDALRYERFLETFGTDEFVLVAISGPELFEEASLDRMLEAVEELEDTPYVHRVFGPPTLYRDLFGSEDAEALLTELTETDFYRNLVISADGETLGLFLTIDAPPTATGRLQLSADIDSALEDLRTAGFAVRLVGPPILTAELDAASLGEARRSLPLAAGASILLLLFLLRSVRATLVAVSCTAATILLILGLMGAVGLPFNMFTAALPALLWVLSLATILHILVRYGQEIEKQPHSQALATALARARFPCTLASVTTAAGFLSLNLAPMKPVRELGSLAALGILLALGIGQLLGPALIELLRPTVGRGVRFPRLGRLTGAAFDRPLLGVLPFAAVGVGALVCLGSIELNSNPLSFLPPKSALLEHYRYVAEELSGLSPLEIVLPTPGGWNNPSVWARAEEIAQRLESDPAVAKVRSPLALLRKLNQWDHDLDPEYYRLPDDAEAADRLLERIDPALEPELRELVAADGESIRLSALLTAMDSERFSEVEELAVTLARQGFGEEAGVTGIVPLLVDAETRLVGSQLRSISLVALVVFASIWIGLRSLWWSAVAMVPNLVPVASVFLIMGVAKLPLDPGTIMVAGVALGIAVDDTVHLVTSLRRHCAGRPSRHAVEQAESEVGGALIITTATATVGFASLIVARFLPIRYFGLLTSVAMLVALAAALFLLPAILGLRYHRSETDQQRTVAP